MARFLLVNTIVTLGAMLALTVQSYQPPEVDHGATAFSASAAWKAYAELAPRGPHPVGSSANAMLKRRLVDKLKSFGFETHVHVGVGCSSWLGCAIVRNIVAKRAGSKPLKGVLLTAHYDSVPAAQGAGDDGSGVAAVLETARLLAKRSSARPLFVLFSDGEEAGLLGARALGRDHPWLKQIGAVINVEARGTSGPSLMFETTDNNAALVASIAAKLDRPMASSLFFEVYRRMPNDTDFTELKRHVTAGLNFAFVGDVRHYHTSRDNPEYLSLSSLQHHGDNLVVAAQALLDASDAQITASGNAVYFDLMGQKLFVWSELTAQVISGGLLLFAIVLLLLSRRFLNLGLRGIDMGIFSILGLVGLSVGLGLVLPRLLGGISFPFVADTNLIACTAAAIAPVALALTNLLFTRRVSFVQGFCASGLFWAVLAVVAAFGAPGIAYLMIIPAGAGLVGWAIALSNRSWLRHFALTIALIGIAAVWAPLAYLLVDGLGVAFPVAYAAIAALLLTPLAGVGGEQSRARLGMPLAATLAILIGLTAACYLRPAYDQATPAHMNVMLFQDVDAKTQRVLVEAHHKRLLPSHLGARLEPVKLLPSWRTYRMNQVLQLRDAPTTPLQVGPTLEPDPSGARGTFTLIPSQPGSRFRLTVRAKAKLSLWLFDAAHPIPASDLRGGATTFVLHGVPREGVKLTLETPAKSVRVLEELFSLPAALSQEVARGDEAVAFQNGDRTVLSRRFPL